MRRRTTWSGRHCDHREHPWPEDGGVRAVMLNFRNWLIADSLGPCLDLILDRWKAHISSKEGEVTTDFDKLLDGSSPYSAHDKRLDEWWSNKSVSRKITV